MRNKPTRTEIVRDAALDVDTGIHRALVLVQRLKYVYGKDGATHKVLNELADILIGIQDRRRIIHQTAEQEIKVERDQEEQLAQLL